jgi:fatty-acyl-CoA synthase
MNVSLSIGDFIYRARTVHGARLGVIDEPNLPGSLGRLTYGDVFRRCDGLISALDRMGVGVGERVAVVSPNAAKLLIALYAVTASGRVLVPINFRLTSDEVQWIIDDPCPRAEAYRDRRRRRCRVVRTRPGARLAGY